jgi:quinone-modifying oxidoreductase, subunit QmoC
MADEILIKPDLQFVKRIMAAGGQDAKKCYQCDTCSVVCNPTPAERPFPRKEMLQAQWGLKDVIKSPDIWLCHQCSDCTVYCPRGAKPGEVMGVLRQMCIEHYAIPPILARMVGDYRFLPLLIALPVVLLLLALKVTGRLAIPEGEIIYAKMFPWYTIDVIFIGAAAFAVFVLAQGVLRYWNDINADPWKVKLKGSVVSQLVPTLTQIVTHEKFKLCETTFARSVNHLLVFFGFVFLGMVTAWAFVLEWVFHQPGPYFLFSPIKILAMVGTALLLYGIYQVIVARQANTEKAGYGTYYDWQLIWMIVAVGVTGLGSWAFRLLGIKLLAYPTYFLHLVAVFFLFFYLPYTKLAHLVYRSVAMLYARMADRGF